MFGGVAKSFVNFEFLTEPYLKDKKNTYYIRVRNPKTNTEREVRFYTDKAHADLMPNKAPRRPLYELFGFKSEDDKILAIADSDITEDEKQQYFYHSKWRYGVFYGGLWYASQGIEKPPIKNLHRFGELTWQQLRKEGQKQSRLLALCSEDESPWFD